MSAIDSISFEQAMEELEKIVKDLEDGRLPLDDAVSAFERGVFLKEVCQQKLEKAQLTIKKIEGLS
jgi:exodeoxyribonuclease VII small subunit